MVKNINGDIYSDVITRSNDNVMPSSYRGGFVPEFIVIHHMATTSFERGMATWYGYNGGGTSANYAVSDTEIVGCIGENYSAWHAGGTGAYDIPNISNINARSIGIEHVNSTGEPSWQVSDATIRNSAKLVADICKRYNIPITRDRIKRHGEITKTQCCGGLDIDKLVRLAQEIANGGQQNNDNSKDELKKEIEAESKRKQQEIERIQEEKRLAEEKARQEEEKRKQESQMTVECITRIKDDGFKDPFVKDSVWYWSVATGFINLKTRYDFERLDSMNMHITGKQICRMPSSKNEPVHLRLKTINGKVNVDKAESCIMDNIPTASE